mmetsp:Transcript_53450/g.124471  ORF Transcript_53450/g.124471 Transcript_53450/m.124471 type:complete len:247 (+) Transcript_53450:528-1268(+)
MAIHRRAARHPTRDIRGLVGRHRDKAILPQGLRGIRPLLGMSTRHLTDLRRSTSIRRTRIHPKAMALRRRTLATDRRLLATGRPHISHPKATAHLRQATARRLMGPHPMTGRLTTRPQTIPPSMAIRAIPHTLRLRAALRPVTGTHLQDIRPTDIHPQEARARRLRMPIWGTALHRQGRAHLRPGRGIRPQDITAHRRATGPRPPVHPGCPLAHLWECRLLGWVRLPWTEKAVARRPWSLDDTRAG